LRSTYFLDVPIAKLCKAWRVQDAAWGAGTVLFAPHWTGILGTMPGTGSGSQFLEAFHSYWQCLLTATNRSHILHVLEATQRLFSQEWSTHFQWAHARSLSLRSNVQDASLLNGAALRRLGRSTAVEWWARRSDNHLHFVRHLYAEKTTRPGSAAVAETTDFYVMRSAADGDAQPAHCRPDPATSSTLVDCIIATGSALPGLLAELGVTRGDPRAEECSLDLQRLDECFVRHCVVMVGAFPGLYWSRFRKQDASGDADPLCTCRTFALYAQCEHSIFVSALRGSVDLAPLPMLKPRGRPKKRP